ncbi:hypothetical protein LTR17_013239 [Elasticomyces elasticus]|nr:hypothetical protein LTR17_013239 [Elasticomyces elasticus]
MQEACALRIGARTIIGPNVKFPGTTTNVDRNARQGSDGDGGFVASAIAIDEDCFIGGEVTILLFRQIGNGAVVEPWSVVTKDIKENMVVAGNQRK